MGNKRGAVYWPLRKKLRNLAIEPLCSMAGATRLQAGLRAGEFDCHWGTMRCTTRRLEYARVPLLELRFWQSEVLDQLARGTFPLEEDPLLPLAHAFRDACEQLEVDAAFVRVRLVPDETALVEKFVRDTKAADIDALCDQGHAALFIADSLGHFPFERLVERECIDTPSGMILFAGRDEGRWY